MKKLNLILLCLVVNITSLSGQIYVKHDATGSNDGTSWNDAYTNLQTAINNANVADEVWVASGTYKPAESPDASAQGDLRSWCFYLNKNIKLYGGFLGTETTLSQRDFIANETILSGEIGNIANFSDNSHHVIIITNTSKDALLDGFTIEHGNSKGGVSVNFDGRTFFSQTGGGIYITYARPTLKNLNISENRANRGGGIYINHATQSPFADRLVMENVTFSFNIAQSVVAGGGILINDANPIFYNAIFEGNRAEVLSGVGGTGGAVALVNSDDVRFYNPVFYNNYAFNRGSAITTDDAEFTILNGTLVNNEKIPLDIQHSTTRSSSVSKSVFFNNGDSSNDDVYGDLDASYSSSTYNASDFQTTYGEIEQVSGHFTDLSSLTATDIFVDINNPKGNDNLWRTFDDGLMPKNGSVLLEAAGNTSGPYIYDVTGEFRFFNIQDLGAYENPGTLSTNPVLHDEQSYKVYPNPTSLGYINIDADEALKIEVYDIVGKKINTIYPTTKTIDVSNLKKGVYLIKISDRKRSETKKVIVN